MLNNCRYFYPICPGPLSNSCKSCMFEGKCKMGSCKWCKHFNTKQHNCKAKIKDKHDEFKSMPGDLQIQYLKFCVEMGGRKKDIAEMFGVSTNTLDSSGSGTPTE